MTVFVTAATGKEGASFQAALNDAMRQGSWKMALRSPSNPYRINPLNGLDGSAPICRGIRPAR